MVRLNDIKMDEISSVNFIEDWTLSTDPLAFTKNVYAIEPVRRYPNPFSDYDDFRYSKTFRFYNKLESPKEISKLKLAATLKYEHFFNLDIGYRTNRFIESVENCINQLSRDYDANQLHGNNNAPFFNGFNQNILVKTILNSVFEGKVKAYDYKSSKLLTPQEAKGKVLVKESVLVVNSETMLEEERTVVNDITSQILSVIFIEEWYFDEESLHLEKRVVGIAPVRYFEVFDSEQSILNREILFKISLN